MPGKKICAVITKRDKPCELPAIREVNGKRVCRSHAAHIKAGKTLQFVEEKTV
jgi:hypothetical protein